MTKDILNFEAKNERSLLAQLLAELLDTTDLFSRLQWAEFLGVSEAAISQWVNDKTLPRPEVLQMIVDVIKASTGVPRTVVNELDRVSRLPSNEITPFGSRLGPTLQHYLLKPLVEVFQKNLEMLSAEERAEVLYESIKYCRIRLRREKKANAANRDDENTAPDQLVEGVQLLKSQQLEPLVRGAGVLRIVGSQRNRTQAPEIVRVFRSDYFDDANAGISSCLPVLWNFDSSAHVGSIPLREMMLFVMRGSAQIRFMGSDRCLTLGSSPRENRLLWISSGKFSGGLPPFELETDEPVSLLGVLYHPNGVSGEIREKNRIIVSVNDWSESDAVAFWEQEKDRPRLLNVGPVPNSLIDLMRFHRENRTSFRGRRNVHDAARENGQIDFASLPWWQDAPSSVLNPMILVLPRVADIGSEEIHVAHHAGQELFIPLYGEFHFACGEIDPGDNESVESHFGHFLENYEAGRHCSGTVSAQVGELPPDLLFLQSNYAHGFYNNESETAYCLHIRCMPGNQRVRKSGDFGFLNRNRVQGAGSKLK